MALTTRVWSAGKIVVLIGALAATYVLAAAASMRLALTAREVTVPNLTNLSANEATAAVTPLGLTLKVDETRRPDPKIGTGRVIAQEPAAESVARRGRSIKVWLSAGDRAPAVPPLTGDTERAATLRLTQDGQSLASVAEIHSDDYPPDVVVAQLPAAKARGMSVMLLVNRGGLGTSYVMPDLVGIDGERAAAILRAQGFRVTVVSSSPYPGAPAGVVLRQTPQHGFQLSPGEPVSLEVSR